MKLFKGFIVVCVLFAIVGLGSTIFTPTNMVKDIRRLGEATVSPDGKLVVYSVITWDSADSSQKVGLWMVAINGGSPAQISKCGGGSPSFSPDSKTLFYTAGDDNGISQIWSVVVAPSIGAPKLISNFPISVDNLKVSKTGKYIAMTAFVYEDMTMEETFQKTQALEKTGSTGTLVDRLFVRRWATNFKNTWRHVFVSSMSNENDFGEYKLAGEAWDVMPKLTGNCPVIPFGGKDQFDFDPQDNELAFTSQVGGSEVAWQTDLNIYLVDLNAKSDPVSITSSNKASDASPSYSPDGNSIAYLCMSVPGDESDKNDVCVYDRRTKEISRNHTSNFDFSVDAIAWSPNNIIYASAAQFAKVKIFVLEGTSPRVLTEDGTSSIVSVLSDTIVFTRNSMVLPGDVFTMDANGTSVVDITSINADLLPLYNLAKPAEFYYDGALGDKIQGFLLKPEGNGPFPLAFMIHGGPEAGWMDDWSYRWNCQPFVARGYACSMINPHGTNSFGMKFQNEIKQDWGGAPIDDLLKGRDFLTKTFDFIDGDRVGALGASYGGYVISWLGGHATKNEFKTMVWHDGIFDLENFFYTTDEMFFPIAEFKGTPWEQPEQYQKWNPRNYVTNWEIPTMVIHSVGDYRIPFSNGMGLFNTLNYLGVETQMLWYPETECHWVTRPDDAVMWNTEVLNWLDRFLMK